MLGLNVDEGGRRPQREHAGSLAMMSTRGKVAASIAALCALAYGLAWAMYLWDHRTIDVTLAVGSTIPPTEPEAVQATRDALSLARLDAEGFEPVPYDRDGHLFARRTDQPREGHVLWRAARSERLWDYLVRCEWQASQVTCGVTRAE